MIAVLFMLAMVADKAVTINEAAKELSDPHPTPQTAPATWFSPNDYPASAVRAREEGAVRFALDVSATGAVTGCRIVESSGHPDLDGQTCASAMQHARFAPALDKRGKPVVSSFVQRTRWVLPAETRSVDAALPFGMWAESMNMVSATATVAVDAQGRVLRCTVARAANTSVDPCIAFPAGKIAVAPSVVDGRPVPATVTAMTIVSVKPDALNAGPTVTSP